MCFILGWRGHLRRCKRIAAFVSGRIEVLEGPLDKQVVRGNGDSHAFRVCGRSFHTSRQPWELLTQGAVYRLHCVDDVLLSLAPSIGGVCEADVEQVLPGRWE